MAVGNATHELLQQRATPLVHRLPDTGPVSRTLFASRGCRGQLVQTSLVSGSKSGARIRSTKCSGAYAREYRHCQRLNNTCLPEVDTAMKISVSTDMEGISGIIDRNLLTPLGYDYERGRKFMAGDTNAAIRGAFAAGAKEVIVSGGHGANGARNLLPEDLHPDAILISGHTRKYRLQSIDDTYDGVVQVGYHARHGLQGILDHTITARHVINVRINNRMVGEVGMNGLVAGHHGVPMVFASGDQWVAHDTKEWFPWAETVVVKHAIGRYAAKCMHPTRAQKLIEERTELAIRNLHQMRPLQLEPPLDAKVTFHLTTHAEAAEDGPGFERIDDCTVRCTADNILQLILNIRTIIRLGASAEPAITTRSYPQE